MVSFTRAVQGQIADIRSVNDVQVWAETQDAIDAGTRLDVLETGVANATTGVVNVLDEGADPAGTTDSTAAFHAVLNAGKTAYAPRGTYLVNLTMPTNGAIVGDGMDQTILKSNPGVNLDVIIGQDWTTLVGKVRASGDIYRGARRVGLHGLTIDGDKATNTTAGYGIKIWGCGHNWDHLKVQNCKTGGIWTEFTTHDGGTINDNLEAYFDRIYVIGCDGDAWRYRGPHDSHLFNYIPFSNRGWALDSSSVTGSYDGTLGIIGNWNSWLNDNSYRFGSSVSHGTNITASAGDVGTGIEFGATTGSCVLTNVSIAGHTTGLIMRGSLNVVEGIVQRCATGVLMDGPSLGRVIMGGVYNGVAIDFTGDVGGQSFVSGEFTVASGDTLYAGAPHAESTIYIHGYDVGMAAYVTLSRTPSLAITAGSATAFSVAAPGYSPHFVVDSVARTVSVGNGGILKAGASWNSSHMMMGAYHLWIDATGDLRIKATAPSSDTDGTVVGAQS